MILKELVDLRDFCFVWVMKVRGEKFAEREYKFQLQGLFIGYYLALFLLFAILQYKAAIPMHPLLEDNFILQMVVTFVMLLPYHFLFKYLFKKMSKFPIDKNMGPNKFKALMRKAILLFIISMALCALIPWSLDRLLPPFN